MQNDAKLLPCPFCGGSADISHDHTVEENHAYGCRACGFWFDTFNSDDPIAAWNTRTPHPAPVTAREAEPTSGTEREAFDFARRVYKETGVTPELRRVYDFYKKARNEPQPSETVAAVERALNEIRDLNMSDRDENGHRWANSDLIDQTVTFGLIALRGLKGESDVR